MSPTRLARTLCATVLVGTTAVLGACGSGGSGTITASAVFSDVNDLVAGAQVQLQDITVGSVKSISLDGNEAKVVMSIRRDAHVPAHVRAELQQTTILGEHFVDLVPESMGGSLANDAVISDTAVIPGIQQLVQSGAQVFGAVNASQLAQIVDNGAQGFGGQAVALKNLLDDFGAVLAGYASRSNEITAVVNQIDQLSSTLAPDATAGATAVSNLAQTTSILAQQSARFETLLQSLDDLAVQGRSILSTGIPQTEDQINALAAVAHELALNQQGLAQILASLPGHNLVTAQSTVNNFIQILNDVIVCGVPGLPSSNTPDATCSPTGGGS